MVKTIINIAGSNFFIKVLLFFKNIIKTLPKLFKTIGSKMVKKFDYCSKCAKHVLDTIAHYLLLKVINKC